MRNRNPWWMRLLQRIGVLSSPASDGHDPELLAALFSRGLHVDSEQLEDGSYQHVVTPASDPPPS